MSVVDNYNTIHIPPAIKKIAYRNQQMVTALTKIRDMDNDASLDVEKKIEIINHYARYGLGEYDDVKQLETENVV